MATALIIEIVRTLAVSVITNRILKACGQKLAADLVALSGASLIGISVAQLVKLFMNSGAIKNIGKVLNFLS